MDLWNPDRYLMFADERGRPFAELLSRIRAEGPRTVVDLGCGPGQLTALLPRRWPRAQVIGIDSSSAMIERARVDVPEIAFEQADLTTWSPARPTDVLVTNATLQWVPDHLQLLPRLLAQVAPGGWFALQLPGNFDEPSHALRRQLAARAPYREHTRAAVEPAGHAPADYLAALTALGCRVDAWETTYLHLLSGEDPVLTWIRGTSLRPTLAALPADLTERFLDELRSLLRTAYPPTAAGVVLPFRRVFAVAQVPA